MARKKSKGYGGVNGRDAHGMPPRGRRCTAKSRSTGKRCRNWAVSGSTVCRMHGAGTKKRPGGAGNAKRPGGRPPLHGLYSKRRRACLKTQVDQLRDDPKLLEIAGHVAYATALQQNTAEMIDAMEASIADHLEAQGTIKAADLAALHDTLRGLYRDCGLQTDRAAKLIERHFRVQEIHKFALTIVGIERALKAMDQVIHDFVDPDKRDAAHAQLDAELGKIDVPAPDGVGPGTGG